MAKRNRPSFRPAATEFVRQLSEEDVLELADVLLSGLRPERPPPKLRVIQGGKKS